MQSDICLVAQPGPTAPQPGDAVQSDIWLVAQPGPTAPQPGPTAPHSVSESAWPDQSPDSRHAEHPTELPHSHASPHPSHYQNRPAQGTPTKHQPPARARKCPGHPPRPPHPALLLTVGDTPNMKRPDERRVENCVHEAKHTVCCFWVAFLRVRSLGRGGCTSTAPSVQAVRVTSLLHVTDFA